ncbi:TetR/AcrR family transcriptional regulator [Gordonia jinhuaensis]|uniref:Transcriptional regulator, TetR family protein n=1 Tax=Gordonia jinhuaensis TaxID=1517702 RepID=A0A916TIT4_9ACTN|nr:putative transcriptional regulator, TetR family protein [Gordonia jinhuaensis]
MGTIPGTRENDTGKNDTRTADPAKVDPTDGVRGDSAGPRPETGRQSRLTRKAIVSAGIEIADAEGLGAVSMRHIAERLGVGAMSLYRHVADKDTLLLAMSDEIGRRFPYPVDRVLPWRERVRVAVELDWDLYQRHPWIVLAYSSPRHSMGEQSLIALDWMVGGILELGVSVEEATEMALTVWIFIQGSALAQVGEELLQTRSQNDDGGALVDLLDGHADFDPPPHLAELAGTGARSSLIDPRQRLDAGIEFLCAGFEERARRSQ